MKINKRPYPISTICSWENKIDAEPDYQRPPVWSKRQKQLLIDSILRQYDIPKLYLHEVKREDGIKFEVIDGQQRLRTIWEFKNDKFMLDKKMDEINEISCGGQKYSELPIDISTLFDSYPLDCVIVEDAIQNKDEDEVKDMFLRFQNGTTLKAQEKRNAMTGQMRDFVVDISKHDFFINCKFENYRYTFDHIAAQLICIEIEGGPTDIRDSNLNRMYQNNTDFDKNCDKARKVRKVLDFLLKAFPNETRELERYNVITLYCVASVLIEKYVHDGIEQKLHNWFIDFETRRRENDALDEEHRDIQLVEYKRRTSSSTDGVDSIRGRVEYIESLFFLKYPDIQLKDKQRSFTPHQRLAIYRKYDGRCAIKRRCNGEKLAWDNWHADHIIPHSKGGKTTVANGQVACSACNFAKSDSL